ncbi:unnamed protein product [Zymoseptoria tritici ST99CH_3D1]|nr:unnamed protein product [Zymoseptoria tritici ST99CH_3D1]
MPHVSRGPAARKPRDGRPTGGKKDAEVEAINLTEDEVLDIEMEGVQSPVHLNSSGSSNSEQLRSALACLLRRKNEPSSPAYNSETSAPSWNNSTTNAPPSLSSAMSDRTVQQSTATIVRLQDEKEGLWQRASAVTDDAVRFRAGHDDLRRRNAELATELDDEKVKAKLLVLLRHDTRDEEGEALSSLSSSHQPSSPHDLHTAATHPQSPNTE